MLAPRVRSSGNFLETADFLLSAAPLPWDDSNSREVLSSSLVEEVGHDSENKLGRKSSARALSWRAPNAGNPLLSHEGMANITNHDPEYLKNSPCYLTVLVFSSNPSLTYVCVC